MRKLSLFERAFFEAPEDEPAPDAGAPDVGNEPAPDAGAAPADTGMDMSAPDDGGDMGGAPDMDVNEDDYFGGDDGSGDNGGNENPDEDLANLGLDDKVSHVLNTNLYQKYLSLLTEINNQLNMIRSNADVMYSLTSDVDETITMLTKLDENVRLYLNNYFLGENYSKNLLFFNKCLNLLKLLTDQFDSKISKGIKQLK